jgi:zinc finger CCHC domain-containing protein 8
MRAPVLSLTATLPACVRPRRDQHPRPRPGALEEEVCVVDSRVAPRGQGGRQGPMGRERGNSGPRLMDAAQGPAVYVSPFGAGRIKDGLDYSLNTASEFVDVEPSRGHEVTDVLYDLYNVVLGATDEVGSERDTDARRCFNCGEPDHSVSACPAPRNNALIALSRQLHEFFRAHDRSDGPTDLHGLQAQNDWQMQRLAWLEECCPGHVYGRDLREALGLESEPNGADCDEDDLPWLKNIAMWGYPPGWVAADDPKEAIRRRILREDTEYDSEVEDAGSLVIFGEDGESERLVFPQSLDQPNLKAKSADATHETSSSESSINDTHPSPPPDNRNRQPRRWAQYPNIRFSCDLLPIYSGSALPALDDFEPSYTPEPANNWRFPGTMSPRELFIWSKPFYGSTNELTVEWRAQHNPPLPLEPAPPLPPPPDVCPPPLPSAPPPPMSYQSPKSSNVSQDDSDMDVSDED